MRIGTAKESNNVDKYCIEHLKIPGIVLMENAALKTIKNIDLSKNSSFTIVCGKGNNGGDGLAVARHLLSLKKEVHIYMIGSGNMRMDCNTNYNILKNMNANISNINKSDDIIEFSKKLRETQVTIDALFGTGLSRNIEGIFYDVITIINENSNFILSIDVPSGFHCDNGGVLGNCIRADKTISFQSYKRGFTRYYSGKLTGDVVIENIGIPKFVVDKFYGNEFILDLNMVKDNLIAKDECAHKGDFGRVTIVAGSKGYTGAAYLATEAAVKTGAGLVTLACRSNIQSILSTKLAEAMTIEIEDSNFKHIVKKSDAVAIGPGMGNNNTTFDILKYVLDNSKCPVVIDADGLNVLKDNLDLLKKYNNFIVITPHLGEMSRLTGLDIEYIEENRIDIAKDFAINYNVIVLLKGFNTIITDGKTTFINPTGSSSMASGGMGDCLTGMIVSLIAQGYMPMEAAYIAAYIHGYCGDKLSKDMYKINATDLLENIPFTINELQYII